MGSTNERRCYIVTSSLIDWAHTQNNPWCASQNLVIIGSGIGSALNRWQAIAGTNHYQFLLHDKLCNDKPSFTYILALCLQVKSPSVATSASVCLYPAVYWRPILRPTPALRTTRVIYVMPSSPPTAPWHDTWPSTVVYGHSSVTVAQRRSGPSSTSRNTCGCIVRWDKVRVGL